jgi:hypothetical protein
VNNSLPPLAEDHVQIDAAKLALYLEDFFAIADALELLSMLTIHEPLIAQESNIRRVASSLHVLGDYLGIRSRDLHTTAAAI